MCRTLLAGIGVSVVWLALMPRVASAGASLMVDDAGTVSNGDCQLESWLRAGTHGSSGTTAPACGLGGLEYDLAVSGDPHGADGSILQAGIKRTLRDASQGSAGFAVSLGTDWQRFDWHLQAVDANFIATLPVGAAWTVHVNLGVKTQPDRPWRASGGLGLEHVVNARWTELAEIYLEGDGYRTAQVGMRRWLKRSASLDFLVGRDRSGGWMTFGFNYAFG